MNTLSVSDINKYIKAIMYNDIILSDVWINGEVSNFKHHYSGHMYFTLKDSNSTLRCVMFKNQNEKLHFVPQNGMNIIVNGYISVFEKDGSYQLYAQSIIENGVGNLYISFMQLKQKLQEEGLFDTDHKKKLPFIPKCIGVVTSETGAVIHDIIKVLNKRFSTFYLKIYPVSVQGSLAAAEISNAIKMINKAKAVDVIILARGGGSIEELWAFNQEILARAIYKSNIPIISAIGHETDYTIADFVADVRAPTPSAAAEMVMPDKNMLLNNINVFKNRIIIAMNNCISTKDFSLKMYTNNKYLVDPYIMVEERREQLNRLKENLLKYILGNIKEHRLKLEHLMSKLEALSSLNVMKRGFCVINLEQTGEMIKYVKQIYAGDKIIITLSDGKATCTVDEVNEDTL